jgi:hypothetical protein
LTGQQFQLANGTMFAIFMDLAARYGCRSARGFKMQDNFAQLEKALEKTDVAKRETLRKLVIGSAFVIPVVTSFALDGLTTPAMASNSTHS